VLETLGSVYARDAEARDHPKVDCEMLANEAVFQVTFLARHANGSRCFERARSFIAGSLSQYRTAQSCARFCPDIASKTSLSVNITAGTKRVLSAANRVPMT